MYHIHGFSFSFNTTKVIFVAEELGIEYQYTALDPSKGEHKTPEHLQRHLFGKTPTLDHDGKVLFESSAICRYLAAVENSPLYPTDDMYQCAVIDQWIDFFSAHTGRWMGTLLFERVYREKFGMGQKKDDVEQEALGFIDEQVAVIDKHLGKQRYLAGDTLSVADCYAFAYIDTTGLSQYSLESYPNVSRWYNDYKSRDSAQQAYAKLA